MCNLGFGMAVPFKFPIVNSGPSYVCFLFERRQFRISVGEHFGSPCKYSGLQSFGNRLGVRRCEVAAKNLRTSLSALSWGFQ